MEIIDLIKFPKRQQWLDLATGLTQSPSQVMSFIFILFLTETLHFPDFPFSHPNRADNTCQQPEMK